MWMLDEKRSAMTKVHIFVSPHLAHAENVIEAVIAMGGRKSSPNDNAHFDLHTRRLIKDIRRDLFALLAKQDREGSAMVIKRASAFYVPKVDMGQI